MALGMARMMRRRTLPAEGSPWGVTSKRTGVRLVGELIGEQAHVGVEGDDVAEPEGDVLVRLLEVLLGALLGDEDGGDDGDAEVDETVDPAAAGDDRQEDEDEEPDDDLDAVVLLLVGCVEGHAVGHRSSSCAACEVCAYGTTGAARCEGAGCHGM